MARVNAHSKENIIATLEKYRQYLISRGYAENRILGVFLYGSQNYCMATAKSDIDAYAIYLPSLEEMCLRKEWLSVEEQCDGCIINVKDLREMRACWMKSGINQLEILFTEYYVINPKYEQVFQHYLVEKRELFAQYDRVRMLKSVGGQAIHTIKQMDGGDGDNKKLYNAYRLYYFLVDYIAGISMEEALVPKEGVFDFLWNLKYSNYYTKEEMMEKGKTLTATITHLVKVNAEVASPKQHSAAAAMNAGIYEIMKLSLDTQSSSKQEFYENLTNAEIRAYHSIIAEVHAEGNIAISALCKKYSISRPVYDKLLSKLQQLGVAEIKAQGVKGTYIRITQPELKAEAIDF